MSNAEQFRVTADYLREQGLSPDFVSRFYRHVYIGASCWPWTACVSRKSYGRISKGAPFCGGIEAHRASWIIHYGPIPEGLEVCHDCPDGDWPRCVNPAHLYVDTHENNLKHSAQKGRMEKGSERWSAKLFEEDIPAIISLREEFGFSQQATASMFGVSRMLVSGIERGKRWRHVARI